MGSALRCLRVEDLEDYINRNGFLNRNCLCLNCFLQNFFHMYSSLFGRQVPALPSSVQGTAALTTTTSIDNSLSDIYRSPPRPLPCDADPRFFLVQRDGLVSRREKGSSHSHEESEPLKRSDIDADSESLAMGDKWSASKYLKTNLWMICKYVDKHTCNVNVRHNHQRQATSALLGRNLVSSFTGTPKNPTPDQVQALMKSQLGVGCNYWKARRMQLKAIETLHGTNEENYQWIYSYLHMVKQANLGTITRVERDANQQFLYAFVRLGVWQRAIPHL